MDKILGISRSHRFSPNSVERDQAIFSAVTNCLQDIGLKVDTICEDSISDAGEYKVAFSMARDVKVLQMLAKEEMRGTRIVNSPQALLNASRWNLTKSFVSQGIPVPFTWMATDPKRQAPFPFWLKRSDACAQSAEDVRLVSSKEEFDSAMTYYKMSDISEIVACEHLTGDLVKFYGVEGTDFFYYHYPTADNAFSKFGLERVNGKPCGYPLDPYRLKQVADHAARISGMTIYGGDCIVREDEQFFIIDFNDWPSFSRCKDEAAQAIGERIERIVRQVP